MKFEPELASGFLLQRYKRFLADIRLEDGSEFTAHCANTGSMRHCAEPGARVWFSTSDNKTRKYPQTLELIEARHGGLAGVNTSRANALVREGIENGTVLELQGYEDLRAEVRYGEENSRIDFVLSHAIESLAKNEGIEQSCYVEVKNVTLGESGRRGLFPDSVTARGSKHLRELMHIKAQGHRAVLFFCVQHSAIDWVEPADEFDPEYGRLLRMAKEAGVELLAYRVKLSAQEFIVEEPLPVVLPRL